MRLIYVALDQTVPGTLGGSVHVRAVAEGLSRLGHDVHVATTPGDAGWPAGNVTWHAMSPPLGTPSLRWLRAGAVTRLARSVGAHAVMERRPLARVGGDEVHNVAVLEAIIRSAREGTRVGVAQEPR